MLFFGEISDMDDKTLFSYALAARAQAYTPYSHFKVGAALLCADGTVYTGCNIENAAFSPTVCAERVAFFKAVSDGCRDFTALAVAGAPEDKAPDAACAPCGVCRQVMAEFCDPETFEILLATENGVEEAYLLKELLPKGFRKSRLEE